MNLIRLLIIAAIVWLTFRIVKNWQAKNTITKNKARKDSTIGNMVQCVKCGVHIPEQEALNYNGKLYCCEEHKS